MIKKGARCIDSYDSLGVVDDVQECGEKIKDRFPERNMFEMRIEWGKKNATSTRTRTIHARIYNIVHPGPYTESFE